MEGNSLIWNCNDAILRKITRNDSHSIILGDKLNSTWIFEVTKSILRNGSMFFNFSLIRDYGPNDSAKINILFIKDSLFWYEEKVSYGINTANRDLKPISLENLSKHKIDIVFFFEQDAKSQKSLQDISFKKADDLREDFMYLLRKKYLADVTVNCGSEVVNAHKVVLFARAPIFEAMVRSEMRESKTNTVTIDDMDASVFRAWIDFVYGGEVQITSVALACGLLDAAEKYQMRSLTEVCIQYLESVLSPENAVHLLEVANLYELSFKFDVISYMTDHLSDFKTSKEWQDLKSRNPALTLEVYSYKEWQEM